MKKARKAIRTLAIDVGGTGLKASILNEKGKIISDRQRVDTPYPCTPRIMVQTLTKLVRPLKPFHRVSIGFPGVVRDGAVITAPHFGNRIWNKFKLAPALSKKLRAPVRLINDAEMQGLAVRKGKGLELVITLGTGLGSALFLDGKLTPHLELAQHPIENKKRYNDYVGDRVRKKIGKKKWNTRVKKMLGILHTLLNYDFLFIGGGNARQINFKLPRNTKRVSNNAGMIGGINLWKD